MTTVNLSVFAGVGAQFFDNDGVILNGGLIYTYEAGSDTPLATYTDSSGDTAHANPIELDSAGKVPGGEIWLESTSVYKFVLATSEDVVLNTYDDIGGSFTTNPIVQRFTGDGSDTTFVLSSTDPTSEERVNIYINGVYQNKDTFSIATDTITFSEAPPLNTIIEVVYT